MILLILLIGSRSITLFSVACVLNVLFCIQICKGLNLQIKTVERMKYQHESITKFLKDYLELGQNLKTSSEVAILAPVPLNNTQSINKKESFSTL